MRIPTLLSRPHPALDLDDDARTLVSLIDGLRTLEELAESCRIPLPRVARALVRLADLGLVDLGGGTAPRTGTPSTPAPQEGAVEESFEDDSDLEIDDVQRASVTAAFKDLDVQTHYQVLGLPPTADRKAVKRAYYERAAAYHPDRHFRKKLGSYKSKMEHIFARITEAHDVLSDRDRRKEYDEYLATVTQSQSLESALEDGARRAKDAEAEIARLQEEAQRQAQAAIAQATRSAVISIPAPIPSAPPPVVATSEALRKAALAQKLLAGRKPIMRPTPAAQAPAQMTAADAVAALRRRYEDAFLTTRQAKVDEQKQIANQALAIGDLTGAVNAYQIATSIAPNDLSLKETLKELQHRATVALHEQYTKQADYEERHGKQEEALKNWKKAVQALPSDPETNSRTALALIKCRGDMHHAAEFAKHAIELAPRDPTYHVTLAKVYLEAGLMPAARSSVDVAISIDPTHTGALTFRKKLAE